MEICFRAHGVQLTEKERSFAIRKVESALACFEQQINKVCFYLADTNGPRNSGDDKACRIVVQVHKQKPLVITGREASVGRVIDGVTDRLHCLVRRRLARMRSVVKPRSRQLPLSP
jgi:hypothetical protein